MTRRNPWAPNDGRGCLLLDYPLAFDKTFFLMQLPMAEDCLRSIKLPLSQFASFANE